MKTESSKSQRSRIKQQTLWTIISHSKIKITQVTIQDTKVLLMIGHSPESPYSSRTNDTTLDTIPSTTRTTSTCPTTSNVQTILAILKGNIGPGCLALPWAFSILGIPLGCMITCLMTLLVGFNAWTLVDLKRKIWGSQRGFTYSVRFMKDHIYFMWIKC